MRDYCLGRLSQFLAKVWLTSRGKRMVASPYTFAGVASIRILPQEMASSGRAPLSEPSNSLEVFKNTLKLAPLRCKTRII